MNNQFNEHITLYKFKRLDHFQIHIVHFQELILYETKTSGDCGRIVTTQAEKYLQNFHI